LNPLLLGVSSFPLALFEPSAAVMGSSYESPAGTLILSYGRTGLGLLALLSGVGWFASLRRSQQNLKPASIPVLALHAVTWSLWAIPIQVIGVFIACSLTAAGHEALSSAWLDHGLWVIVAAAALAFGWRSSQGEPGNV